jgi:cyclopropane fatty-acyl-phospholipid synthase-like methyltransferase
MNWLKYIYFNFLYLRNPPWDTQVSPPELLEFIENNSPGRALDLGCGTGTNVIQLAQHGWQVVGVDFVKKAVRMAERKAELSGVEAEFIVDDVSKLAAVDGLFDFVLDIGCFHSLAAKEKRSYVSNLARLTKTGSTLLMYCFIHIDNDSGSGITSADLQSIEELFSLAKRVDGTERGERPSAWFTFQRKPTSDN